MTISASEQALWEYFCILSKASRHYRPISEPAVAAAYQAWLASLTVPARPRNNVIPFPERGARS
jgi:hypothetical protein